MRAFLVLCALVAAPFAVSVSQSAPAADDGDEQCENANGDGDHSNDLLTLTGQQAAEEGEDADQPCEPVPPPPPPPQGATIDGRVFDVATGLGLSGWSVNLSGTVTATALTDVNGNYIFTGLPAGTYTVCEGTPMPGFTQTFPPSGATCPFGFGYGPFTLTAGQGASFNNFGNTHL
jgi:carboxypeptidase family protein